MLAATPALISATRSARGFVQTPERVGLVVSGSSASRCLGGARRVVESLSPLPPGFVRTRRSGDALRSKGADGSDAEDALDVGWRREGGSGAELTSYWNGGRKGPSRETADVRVLVDSWLVMNQHHSEGTRVHTRTHTSWPGVPPGRPHACGRSRGEPPPTPRAGVPPFTPALSPHPHVWPAPGSRLRGAPAAVPRAEGLVRGPAAGEAVDARSVPRLRWPRIHRRMGSSSRSCLARPAEAGPWGCCAQDNGARLRFTATAHASSWPGLRPVGSHCCVRLRPTREGISRPSRGVRFLQVS